MDPYEVAYPFNQVILKRFIEQTQFLLYMNLCNASPTETREVQPFWHVA